MTTVADSIGRGLLAGMAGTAAMTASSTLEARLRGRAASSAPARATAKVLGIRAFESDLAQARFNDLSHWGYGTGWGIARGLFAALGLSPRQATIATARPSTARRRSPCPRSTSPRRRSTGARRRSPSTRSTTRSTRPPPDSPTS